jgi:hypothetical protein
MLLGCRGVSDRQTAREMQTHDYFTTHDGVAVCPNACIPLQMILFHRRVGGIWRLLADSRLASLREMG